MNEFSEPLVRLCGRIVRTAVEVTAAGRHQASAEFRGTSRSMVIDADRLNHGAIVPDTHTHLRVQLENPYAEYLLEQMLNTLEAMR